MLCWAKENLSRETFQAVFVDTGWEHPVTYEYVEYINKTILDGRLVTVKSQKYEGFEDLCLKKKMVPSVHSRFCTQELKIFPLHEYYESLDDEVTVYVGIRRDESFARGRMKNSTWVDDGGGYRMEYPLFDWTSRQCFDLMKKHGVNPNPLYLLGARRVGCYPCIMTSHGEMKAYLKADPIGLKDRLMGLESRLNTAGEPLRTFFRSNYIPERFRSQSVLTKKGKTVAIPTVQDVLTYLESQTDEAQLSLFDVPACLSVYNLCE